MSAVPSNKPYLIRALHQWCVDHGFTPYIAVFVTEEVQVPMDYVKDNEIVLNISPDACQQLSLDNEWISLKARFGRSASRYSCAYEPCDGDLRERKWPGHVFSRWRKQLHQNQQQRKNTPISKGRPSLKLVK